MIRTILIAGTVLTGFAMGGQKAEAVDYQHIDSLALHLQNQTTTLHHEAVARFNHSAHAKHLLNDAAQMRSRAVLIHQVAHRGGSVPQLRIYVSEIDRLYHHMQLLIRQIENEAWFGIGQTTKHLMQQIGDTVHHLHLVLRPPQVVYYVPRYGYNYGHDHRYRHDYGRDHCDRYGHRSYGYGHRSYGYGSKSYGYSSRKNTRVVSKPSVPKVTKPSGMGNHRNFGNSKPRFSFPN